MRAAREAAAVPLPAPAMRQRLRAVPVQRPSRTTSVPSGHRQPATPTSFRGWTTVPMGPQFADVSKCLCSKFENTAPGDDGLTYRHWKRLDPECTVLTEVIHVCLRYKMVPSAWKRAVTVLIYKKGAKEDLNNWRPISLSRTLYKLLRYSLLPTIHGIGWQDIHG